MNGSERTQSRMEKSPMDGALDLLRSFEEDEDIRSRTARHRWGAVDDSGSLWLYLEEPVRDAAGIWMPGMDDDDAWWIGEVRGEAQEAWARILLRRTESGWEAVPAEAPSLPEQSCITEDERQAHIARLEELSAGEAVAYITALHTLYTHRYGDAYLRTADRSVLHMNASEENIVEVTDAAAEFIRDLP